MRKLLRVLNFDLLSTMVQPSVFLLQVSLYGASSRVQVCHLEQIFAAVFGRPEAVVTVGGELGRETAPISLLLSDLREFHGVALNETQFLGRPSKKISALSLFMQFLFRKFDG